MLRDTTPDDLPTANAHRLSPAGHLLWRSNHTVQFEIGQHRVVVDGVSETAVRALLDGAARPTPEVLNLRRELSERGYLWPEDEQFAPPTPRLAAELTALAARYGPAAADVLTNRTQRRVFVQGMGRAGSLTASLLAAAGVGRVHLIDRAQARLVHAIPGGVVPGDEGAPLAEATAASITRCAPETDVAAPALGEQPDLVVLAVDEPVDSDRRDALHARGVAHLVVATSPAGGVVGPLVVPGLTSCLACADLHRRDRDSAWPALAAQLTVPRRYPRTAEVAVTAAAAGLAAGQALAFLDGEQPRALEGTLELSAPDWRIRRRTWPAHPECVCMSM